jgi:hypothetical protein
MSVCYDFQKWTIISLASVAITLTIGLISLAYGQEINNSKLFEDMSNSSKLYEQMMKPYAKLDNLKTQMDLLQSEKQSLEAMINYCFEHADRPNPLQDLIDKALLPANMTGITCPAVKQMMIDLNNKINVFQTAINEETAKTVKRECKYIPTKDPAIWDKICPNDREYDKIK